MMSRKDYVNVADILSEYKGQLDPIVFEDLVSDFCDFFFADNPNFSPPDLSWLAMATMNWRM
jgi:hypothetical protein